MAVIAQTVDMNEIESQLRNLILKCAAPDSQNLHTGLSIAVAPPVNIHHLMSMTGNRDTAGTPQIQNDATTYGL